VSEVTCQIMPNMYSILACLIHSCIQYHCRACYTTSVVEALVVSVFDTKTNSLLHALHIPVCACVVTQQFEAYMSDVTYQIVPRVYKCSHRIRFCVFK
jgi:hypothetical protein